MGRGGAGGEGGQGAAGGQDRTRWEEIVGAAGERGESMTVAENIRVAEEHLEAEAKRELDRLLGTLHDEAVYEESLLEVPARGRDAIGQYYRELWAAFPDFTYEVTNRVADERCVIYEMTFGGTQVGPFRGIPATGRPGKIKGVVVFPFKDGLATGERIYLDGYAFLRQLDVLPDPKGLTGRVLFALLRLRMAIRRMARGKR